MIEHTTGGQMSLAELADGHKCQPSAILRLTAEHSPGNAYPANVAAYINGVFRGTSPSPTTCPPGCTCTCPDGRPRRPARTFRPRCGGLPAPAPQPGDLAILRTSGAWARGGTGT